MVFERNFNFNTDWDQIQQSQPSFLAIFWSTNNLQCIMFRGCEFRIQVFQRYLYFGTLSLPDIYLSSSTFTLVHLLNVHLLKVHLLNVQFSNNTFTFVASLSLSYRTAYLYCYHHIVTPSWSIVLLCYCDHGKCGH